jgi:hypothetical protein
MEILRPTLVLGGEVDNGSTLEKLDTWCRYLSVQFDGRDGGFHETGDLPLLVKERRAEINFEPWRLILER